MTKYLIKLQYNTVFCRIQFKINISRPFALKIM